MKNILTLILMLLLSNISLAQTVLTTTSLANENETHLHSRKGNYAIDTANERNQYVGLWRYNQNGILFEIKIELKNQYLNKLEHEGELISYTYKDVVTLKYKLIKNGILIYDNLNMDVDLIPEPLSYGSKFSSYEYLDGRFLDYTRNVYAYFTIKKLNGLPEKIIFEINELNYMLLNPREFYVGSGIPLFTVPTGQVEMIKVN